MGHIERIGAPGVSEIQTECHPRSRLPVLSKNTNELKTGAPGRFDRH